MNLPRIVLNAGSHRIHAHVARTESDRAQGLMHCRNLGEDEGMLFIHDAPEQSCFWMKDTPLHLSIAFIGDDGAILHVEEMDAHSLDTTCAAWPARFILEMKRGWFSERGIAGGCVLEGLPRTGAESA